MTSSATADVRAVRAVRVRVPDEVVAAVEPAEPDTSPLLAPLFEPGLGRSCRAWALRAGAPGAVVGAVVLVRSGIDAWTAFVHVAPGWEGAAAPAVARVLDAAPARVARGGAAALSAAAPHLRRLRELRVRRGVWAWPGGPAAPPAGGWAAAAPPVDGVRRAAPADVDALVALFGRTDPAAGRSRRALARGLRHDVVGDGVLVAERDGALVGAVTTTGHTRRYVVGGAVCVDPAVPAAEVVRALVQAGRREASRRGLGLVADRPPRRGRDGALAAGDAGGDDPGAAGSGRLGSGVGGGGAGPAPRADVRLRPRQRFRGQRRAVELGVRVLRRLER